MGLGTMMIAAGALQGVGGAMAQQGMLDAQQRREIALENLRTQNKMSEHTNQYNLMDRNNSRQTIRETNNATAIAGVQATLTNESNAQNFKNNIKSKEVDFNYKKKLAQFESDLNATKEERLARLKNELASGEVVDVFAGGDGIFYKRTRDGLITSTGIAAPAKETEGRGSGGGNSMLDNARANSSGGAAKPTKLPGPVGMNSGQTRYKYNPKTGGFD